ncbi:hypothetical protein MNBD_DELTA01-1700 [hydrothermal vent metagenome]|uniref:Putative Se/S carrier protein-like domain-containing protein n=1 Tax=hydrothermal vent metagenome TaxID=652676 RepID=A0A3B0QYK7_9ZZZZ
MKNLLAFGSTHIVLKAESVLQDQDIPFRLNPAPSALTAYCDLVITVDGDIIDKVVIALNDAGITPKGVYRKEKSEYVKL